MGSPISQPVDEIERVRRRVLAELAQSGSADTGHPERRPSALVRARRSLVQAWVLAGMHRGSDR